MKMFRKQIASVLTAILVLSLGTACANPSHNTAPSSATNESAVAEEEGTAAEGEGTALEGEGAAAEENVAADAAESSGAGSTQGAQDTTQPVQGETPPAEGGITQPAQGGTTQPAQGETPPAEGGTAQTAQGAPAPATGNTADAAQSTPAPAAGETDGTEQAAQGNPAPAMVKGQPENNPDVLLPGFTYTLRGTKEVDGRQGVACENGEYWISGSTTLTHYDKGWRVVATNDDPFKEFEVKVNHIGDIDVYNGEIYVGAENFADGVGSDIQIAVYDAQTLQLSRTYMFNQESGQEECSGIAVDPDTKSIWMCSWVGDESGRYLYRYSLDTGEYIGKIHLQAPPQWLQGVAYYNG